MLALEFFTKPWIGKQICHETSHSYLECEAYTILDRVSKTGSLSRLKPFIMLKEDGMMVASSQAHQQETYKGWMKTLSAVAGGLGAMVYSKIIEQGFTPEAAREWFTKLTYIELFAHALNDRCTSVSDIQGVLENPLLEHDPEFTRKLVLKVCEYGIVCAQNQEFMHTLHHLLKEPGDYFKFDPKVLLDFAMTGEPFEVTTGNIKQDIKARLKEQKAQQSFDPSVLIN